MSRLLDARDTAQVRLTLAAALATVLATVTLTPIFTRTHWLAASVVAIVVVAAVGCGGRALALPRAVVLLLQVGGLAVVAAALFAPQSAILGLIPTPSTGSELLDLARAGTASINQQTVPVLDVPGIVLLVTLGIGIAAIEVDFTAVACRCPAISGIVLLAIYSVPVIVLREGTPWIGFVVAASGWLLLLYVARREAVHEWGTVLRADRPDGEPVGMRPNDPRAALGWRIAAGTLTIGLALAALTPGLGEGVVGRFGPGDGSGGPGTSAVRLDLTATLERNLTARTNLPLLSYRADDRGPHYLRMAVLNQFDGVAWKPSQQQSNAPSIYEGPQAIPGLSASAPSTLLLTEVRALEKARDLSYLPGPYTPVAFSGEINGSWLWDISTSTAFSRETRLNEDSYLVTSQTIEPLPERLAARSSALNAVPADRIAPEGLPQSLGATAADVTEGANTDYAKAVRLQGWFRSNFTYSLDTKPVESANALTSFLSDRSGYCQQFAATFALMARTLAIPTRVVVGFTPGTQSRDGWYVVGTRDYHAWPEVWFDDAGWVRFEPTPRADPGSSVDVPAWSLPGPFAPATIPEKEPSAEPIPTPIPSNTAARPPVNELTTAASTSTWTSLTRPIGALALFALVLLLAAGPAVARARRRRRRLAGPPNGPGVEMAWAELADTARDLGLAWPDQDTPRRTADAFVVDAGLGAGAATGVQQLRRELEEVRYAPRPQITSSPGEIVRGVRGELLTASTPRTRWRALLLPRTLLRRGDRGSGRRQ